MNLSARKGHFKIPYELVRKMVEGEVAFTSLMSNFLIVKCENLFMSGEIEYYAYSPYFKEVGDHTVAPKYELLVEYIADEANGPTQAILRGIKEIA